MCKKPTSSAKFSSATFTVLLLFLTGCNNGEAIQSFLSADPQLSTSQNTTSTKPITESPEIEKPSATERKEPKNNQNTDQSELIDILPPDFPPEIPLYPKAILESIESPGGEKGTATLRSQDNLESVVSYYQEEFAQNDWKILKSFPSDLEELDKTIITSKDNLKVKIEVIPQQPSDQTFPTRIAIAYKPFDDSLVAETATEPKETPTPAITAISQNYFSDLEEVPEQLRQAVKQVAALDILTPHLEEGEIKKFAPNEPITRRDYARWLVAANNKYYGQSPGKKIRLATTSSELAFQDIKPNDPDFAAIQGLAEAGLIPSVLTQENDNLLFRPEAPLTREDLLVWKVPLDIRKALPKASIENIEDSWGFQDATSINTLSMRALFADFQNGDNSNVRRMFGYTTLFQPKKSVTRGEAVASLWYFGFQGDGMTAKEALKVDK